MTTLHKNDEIHISMLAERQEVLIKDDKLISSDGGSRKTKNIRLGDLQCKAICPWKIEKFIISEAQILASSYGNPIFLLPMLGVQEWYTVMARWMNTFKNVVTNPANPFVVGAAEELSLSGYYPTAAAFSTNPFFPPMTQNEFTSTTTQVTRLARTGGSSYNYTTQSQNNFFNNIALHPNVGSNPGWIVGEGYWEIELMYMINNIL